MTGDLGSSEAEVHAKASDVLAFWFDEVPPEQHFSGSEALDDVIQARFAGLRAAVVASEAAAWRDDPDVLLAAILLIDQFGRNLFRGQGEAFAADALAQRLVGIAIDRGWDRGMPAERRQFLYMPLMHAEDLELQTLSLQCFAQDGLERNLDFARDHAAVIAKFGRFPTRNAALGRESTSAEMEYLSQPGVGWG